MPFIARETVSSFHMSMPLGAISSITWSVLRRGHIQEESDTLLATRMPLRHYPERTFTPHTYLVPCLDHLASC